MSQRLQFIARLRNKIKAAGVNGEFRDLDGTAAGLQWIPREDSTPQQTATANSIMATYDSAADAAQNLAEERASATEFFTNAGINGKAARALAITINDRTNALAVKINAILTAIDNAATLAALKTAIAAIPDLPVVTIAQAKTTAINNVNTGAGD